MHMMSPVQQASLGIWKSLNSADINIALYDFVRKKDDLNTVVSNTLLYSGITSHPHPSDQHVLHYITITKNLFGKIK